MIDCTLLLHAICHWPNYTTSMMWPFALKESSFCLNKLSIQADGRSNEITFFGINGDIIEPAIFHTIGCPCFVLYARLKSGIITCPKWEPWSQLGIYVVHLHIGGFTDTGFHSAAQESNQTITFCAVGGHHQNGVFET